MSTDDERVWPVRDGRWAVQQKDPLTGVWASTMINLGFAEKEDADLHVRLLNQRQPDCWSVFDRFRFEYVGMS